MKSLMLCSATEFADQRLVSAELYAERRVEMAWLSSYVAVGLAGPAAPEVTLTSCLFIIMAAEGRECRASQ